MERHGAAEGVEESVDLQGVESEVLVPDLGLDGRRLLAVYGALLRRDGARVEGVDESSLEVGLDGHELDEVAEVLLAVLSEGNNKGGNLGEAAIEVGQVLEHGQLYRGISAGLDEQLVENGDGEGVHVEEAVLVPHVGVDVLVLHAPLRADCPAESLVSEVQRKVLVVDLRTRDQLQRLTELDALVQVADPAPWFG